MARSQQVVGGVRRRTEPQALATDHTLTHHHAQHVARPHHAGGAIDIVVAHAFWPAQARPLFRAAPQSVSPKLATLLIPWSSSFQDSRQGAATAL
jgi:hypothetical protein